MKFYQKQIQLASRSRGFHLVTDEIVSSFPELREFSSGMMQVFVKHTSASLTLNENADPSVRIDLERHMNELVPEDQDYYTHTYEGSDDMPAHIKASLMGSSILLPVTKGRLNLGTWQGIYLCEHRDHGGSRRVVLSAWGV
jgi:secondary thiamine-phosphate synthase enzyme